MIFRTPTKKGPSSQTPVEIQRHWQKHIGMLLQKRISLLSVFLQPSLLAFGNINQKRKYIFQEIHFWIHLYIYWFLQLYSISRKILKGRAFRSRYFLGPKSSQWLGKKGLCTQFSHFGRCNESVRNNPLKFERLFFALWAEPEKTSLF